MRVSILRNTLNAQHKCQKFYLTNRKLIIDKWSI